MVDAVTSQTLLDGDRNIVMKFTNISDGSGEAAVKKVDVSALGKAATGVVIERIDYMTDGMQVNILWDATANVSALLLPTSDSGTLDFKDMGGITNNSGAGSTGDILFTTTGHTALDTYTIVLHMRRE